MQRQYVKSSSCEHRSVPGAKCRRFVGSGAALEVEAEEATGGHVVEVAALEAGEEALEPCAHLPVARLGPVDCVELVDGHDHFVDACQWRARVQRGVQLKRDSHIAVTSVTAARLAAACRGVQVGVCTECTQNGGVLLRLAAVQAALELRRARVHHEDGRICLQYSSTSTCIELNHQASIHSIKIEHILRRTLILV